MLIDYSLNPNSSELRYAEIEKNADSPFEVGVARALVNRGYRIVQQWKVGAYRLDMVAVCGKKTVAIECDGERYHSGETKIREDMERQTILERLGWRFIRIRGSEYFRNPDETIERVVKELSVYGIEPEGGEVLHENKGTNYELLERVKACAARIISGAAEEKRVDIDTIAAALDSKSIVESNTVPEKTEPISCESESAQAKSDLEKKESISTSQLGKNTSSSSKRTNKSVKANTKKSTKQLKTPMPEQLVMPGTELSENTDTDVIALLKKNNVMYIDKRSNNGALWIIGGKELIDIVKQCRKLGIKFTFKEDGGRVTKGKAGWWAK